MAQGSYHQGGGHYPYGGSKRLADNLVDFIRKAGGEVETERRVTRIARGVSLFPDWTGAEQVRLYELDGDRLTLRAPPIAADGTTVTVELRWARDAFA